MIAGEFTLIAGYWEYWFRDKKTKNPLTQRYSLFVQYKNTKVTVFVPDDLKDSPNIEVYIQRTR